MNFLCPFNLSPHELGVVVAGSGSTGRPGSWGLEAGQEWCVDPGLKAPFFDLPTLLGVLLLTTTTYSFPQTRWGCRFEHRDAQIPIRTASWRYVVTFNFSIPIYCGAAFAYWWKTPGGDAYHRG